MIPSLFLFFCLWIPPSDLFTASTEVQLLNPMQQSLQGRVIRIVDGDTFELLLASREKMMVRLEGIDAPERGMPFATVSKNYLAQGCFQQSVRIEVVKFDRWKRPIARVYVNGSSREFGEQMVRAGMAWHFTKYSSSSTLAQAEREARAARRGLWADVNPVAPWLWRKAKRGNK
jgi:endonuclease YncB( thermonuclease family)